MSAGAEKNILMRVSFCLSSHFCENYENIEQSSGLYLYHVAHKLAKNMRFGIKVGKYIQQLPAFSPCHLGLLKFL